jgi:hypothetical protein
MDTKSAIAKNPNTIREDFHNESQKKVLPSSALATKHVLKQQPTETGRENKLKL